MSRNIFHYHGEEDAASGIQWREARDRTVCPPEHETVTPAAKRSPTPKVMSAKAEKPDAGLEQARDVGNLAIPGGMHGFCPFKKLKGIGAHSAY